MQACSRRLLPRPALPRSRLRVDSAPWRAPPPHPALPRAHTVAYIPRGLEAGKVLTSRAPRPVRVACIALARRRVCRRSTRRGHGRVRRRGLLATPARGTPALGLLRLPRPPVARSRRKRAATQLRNSRAHQMASLLPSRRRSGSRGAAVLACSLLALLVPRAHAKGAAARSASSASGGSASTATGAQFVGTLSAVLDNSPAAVEAKANVVAQVSPVLQGVTMRCAGARLRPPHAPLLRLRLRGSAFGAHACAVRTRARADILIMRTGTTWRDAGDGFAHLSQENPNLLPLMAEIAQARTPGSLRFGTQV